VTCEGGGKKGGNGVKKKGGKATGEKKDKNLGGNLKGPACGAGVRAVRKKGCQVN